jgi:hyperpolarization activated cyclic nucleotide-gated potassium channel 2
MDVDNSELYVTAFYFTVTTLVTVGYGDITAYSFEEKVFAIFLMLLGVVSFSFATGTIASIITSYDSQEAVLKEKIATLNDMQIEYDVDI